jgi:hypothetical protein
MFRPYLAIFRQLFIFRNRYTAVDLKSKNFSSVAYRCSQQNKTLSPFCVIFLMSASTFVPRRMRVLSSRVYVTFVLPEDGQVRPKHVATDCDFNVILN